MDVKLLAPPATRFAVVALVACSGKTTTPKTVAEDALGAVTAQPGEAGVAPGGEGDVRIRVEWEDVPVAARMSPGRTPCNTPLPPSVEPSTLWGIPDVFVSIDTAKSAARTAQRVVLEPCALSPRAAVTSGSFTIASATEAPTKVFVQRAGQLPLGGAIADDKPRPVFLPIAGHEVEVAVDADTIVRVIAGDEDAWVVATENPFVAITEASGNAVLRGVPAGTHAVTAWLPPRSGQPARVARGEVTVTAGALAEVTLDISKP